MIRDQETLNLPRDSIASDPRMNEPNGLLAALPARIDAIVRAHARATPAAPALREDGRSVTYAELETGVDACAAWLRGLGVREGERVMLVSENCIAQVTALFAIASLDAWFVNVNARLTPPELETIRSHCGARVVLYTAAASKDAAAHAARAGAGSRAHGELMASLHADGAVPEADMPVPEMPEPSRARQTAALVYTTGTTGNPKGVMLSHRNLLFVAAVSSRLRGVVPGDLAYGVLPVSHVYGLTSVLLGTLYAGACLRLAARFTPRAMLDAIRGGELTIVQGVPAMYARLLELCAVDGAGVPLTAPLASNLRFAYAGGSPLDPSLKRDAERLLGVPLHNGYGLTEAAPTVSQTRLDAPRADTSVGHPIPGVEVRVDGPDGQLFVRGPNVMQGYYRDPDGTRAVLGDDGWLDTGDLARRGPDGALFIAGRSKELINRSGFKVYPLEVETVLNAHPAVTQSAVVGRALPDGDEEVVAFVQPAAGSLLSADALAAWAAARLAPYKRPARIVLMDSLPAAPSGKVLKHKLKASL
jgi:acyl-CoA synthetase (AMP-forming)/AMP-acid ligase II